MPGTGMNDPGRLPLTFVELLKVVLMDWRQACVTQPGGPMRMTSPRVNLEPNTLRALLPATGVGFSCREVMMGRTRMVKPVEDEVVPSVTLVIAMEPWPAVARFACGT